MTGAQKLEAAADLIEREGLWKQSWGDNGQPEYDSGHCAFTAMRRYEPNTARTRILLGVDAGGLGQIFLWNDAPERTQADVVRFLRERAAELEEQPAQPVTEEVLVNA